MALAHALPHTGKYRHPLHGSTHRMHEFHHQHRLAHTGTAEKAGLSTPHEGTEQIDDLDARFQYPGGGKDFGNRWGRRKNISKRHGGEYGTPVQGLPEHIEHAAKASWAHRHV